jgi:hypothetical protein
MNNIVIPLACVLGILVAQGGACRSERAKVVNANTNVAASPAPDKLQAGVWGGEHVRAEITEAGAQFEFDCANGRVARTIVLDSHGRFDLTGTFSAEHGGPVQRDETGNSRAVRYSGAVKDNEMTLTITASDTKEEIGSYTLKHGNDGRVRKCR